MGTLAANGLIKIDYNATLETHQIPIIRCCRQSSLNKGLVDNPSKVTFITFKKTMSHKDAGKIKKRKNVHQYVNLRGVF